MPSRKITAGMLRAELRERNAPWRIDPNIADHARLPVHGLGGSNLRAVPADALPRINFKRAEGVPPSNSYLLRERILRGHVSPEMKPAGGNAPVPYSGSAPALFSAVDWRDRWGWSWVTDVRDQGGCNNCWAFAATALIESMVRIEHCVWAPRSEGDVLFAVPATCANSGDIKLALDAVHQSGIADKDCDPWVPMVTNYTPTIDRSGRTVKIPQFELIGNIDDQKEWLLTVGPLGSAFYVWKDFMYGYGHNGAVYIWDSTQKPYVDAANPGDELGWHALLVVGFNDALQAWIVKNSWGANWGFSGFAYIGYGQTEIDSQARYALRGTNPDPWCKRRLHNGNLLESDAGNLHNDFEVVAAIHGTTLEHWRRRNDQNNSWQKLETFANDVSRFRPTLIQSTYIRNFEAVYQTTNGRLHHWWFDQGNGHWHDGGIFGPLNTAGVPGFMQSNYGAPGNFEIVVRTADGQLSQWWRSQGSGGPWTEGQSFARGVTHSGATLVQSQAGLQGDFHLVCVLSDGTLQHWRRDNDAGQTWSVAANFGFGIDSPPCMIESQFGATTDTDVGNFELCVAVNGQVHHWWRENGGDQVWKFGGAFGQDIMEVTGLVQSSYGFDLELVVLRNDLKLQHYWRDDSGWHAGPIIAGP